MDYSGLAAAWGFFGFLGVVGLISYLTAMIGLAAAPIVGIIFIVTALKSHRHNADTKKKLVAGIVLIAVPLLIFGLLAAIRIGYKAGKSSDRYYQANSETVRSMEQEQDLSYDEYPRKHGVFGDIFIISRKRDIYCPPKRRLFRAS